jgi:integrase
VAPGRQEISPTTLEDYRLQINRRIVPALGNLPVRRLDAETLDRFYAELRKRGRGNGKPLSASQVRSVHIGAVRCAQAGGRLGMDQPQPRSAGHAPPPCRAAR